MAAYTHYTPRHWRRRHHTYDVRDEFLALFRYRVELFLQVRTQGKKAVGRYLFL